MKVLGSETGVEYEIPENWAIENFETGKVYAIKKSIPKPTILPGDCILCLILGRLGHVQHKYHYVTSVDEEGVKILADCTDTYSHNQIDYIRFPTVLKIYRQGELLWEASE